MHDGERSQVSKENKNAQGVGFDGFQPVYSLRRETTGMNPSQRLRDDNLNSWKVMDQPMRRDETITSLLLMTFEQSFDCPKPSLDEWICEPHYTERSE